MVFSEKVLFLGVILAAMNSCGCNSLGSNALGTTTANTYAKLRTAVPTNPGVLIRAGARPNRTSVQDKDQQVETQ